MSLVVCQMSIDLVEPVTHWDDQMSSYPSGHGLPLSQPLLYCPQQYQPRPAVWSLNDLSTELLALIFQQVRFSPFAQRNSLGSNVAKPASVAMPFARETKLTELSAS